jgi:mRNA interferase MazF
MVIKRGEVWWAELGAARGSGPGFRRPIVIIQSDDFNQTRLNTTLGVVITTNLRLAEMPGNIMLRKSVVNLPKDSVINVTQVVTVDKHDLLERMGRLSEEMIEQIENGLRLVLSL